MLIQLKFIWITQICKSPTVHSRPSPRHLWWAVNMPTLGNNNGSCHSAELLCVKSFLLMGTLLSSVFGSWLWAQHGSSWVARKSADLLGWSLRGSTWVLRPSWKSIDPPECLNAQLGACELLDVGLCVKLCLLTDCVWAFVWLAGEGVAAAGRKFLAFFPLGLLNGVASFPPLHWSEWSFEDSDELMSARIMLQVHWPCMPLREHVWL